MINPEDHQRLIEQRAKAKADRLQARLDGDEQAEEFALRRLYQVEKDLDRLHGSPVERYRAS